MLTVAERNFLTRVGLLLKEKGWIQRTRSNEKGFCLMAAIDECAKEDYLIAQSAIALVDFEIAKLGQKDSEGNPLMGIIRWQDHPGRKFEDVLKVLRKLVMEK